MDVVFGGRHFAECGGFAQVGGAVSGPLPDPEIRHGIPPRVPWTAMGNVDLGWSLDG